MLENAKVIKVNIDMTGVCGNVIECEVLLLKEYDNGYKLIFGQDRIAIIDKANCLIWSLDVHKSLMLIK